MDAFEPTRRDSRRPRSAPGLRSRSPSRPRRPLARLTSVVALRLHVAHEDVAIAVSVSSAAQVRAPWMRMPRRARRPKRRGVFACAFALAPFTPSARETRAVVPPEGRACRCRSLLSCRRDRGSSPATRTPHSGRCGDLRQVGDAVSLRACGAGCAAHERRGAGLHVADVDVAAWCRSRPRSGSWRCSRTPRSGRRPRSHPRVCSSDAPFPDRAGRSARPAREQRQAGVEVPHVDVGVEARVDRRQRRDSAENAM